MKKLPASNPEGGMTVDWESICPERAVPAYPEIRPRVVMAAGFDGLWRGKEKHANQPAFGTAMHGFVFYVPYTLTENLEVARQIIACFESMIPDGRRDLGPFRGEVEVGGEIWFIQVEHGWGHLIAERKDTTQ